MRLVIVNNRINSPFNCRMFSESSNRRNLNLTTWLKQPKVYGSHQLSSKYQLKVKVSVLSDLVPASPWYPHYLGFSPLSDNFYTARLPEWGHKVIFSFYLTSHNMFLLFQRIYIKLSLQEIFLRIPYYF